MNLDTIQVIPQYNLKLTIEEIDKTDWDDRGVLDEDEDFLSCIQQVFLVKTKDSIDEFGGIHFYLVDEGGDTEPYFYTCLLRDDFKTDRCDLEAFFQMVAWIVEWSMD
jgi:hypothetical protein